MNYTVDTYKDINEIDRQELMNRISKDFSFRSKSKYTLQQQFKIMEKISEWLGLDMCNEQSMFVMMGNKSVLCEAVAGSGKTTISQLRICRYKIFEEIPGSEVMCIAYNEHAVNDMIKRHKEICKTINGKGIKGLNIDLDLKCRTFHSLALSWVETYKDLVGIRSPKVNLLSESKQIEIMRKALASSTDEKIFDKAVSDVVGLYEYLKQTNNYSIEDWATIPKFNEMSYKNQEVIRKAYTKYERIKKVKDVYDFTDIVTKFYEIIQNSEALKYIQSCYKIFIVDEYQDFTPLMRECLETLASHPTIELTCVGDGDQSIYGFRGTDGTNCVTFRERFEDATIVTMSKNRRCKDNIVKVAREVILLNKIRNDKPLLSIKEGGVIENIEYPDVVTEMDRIVLELKDIYKRTGSVNNICICYRNKESSSLLTSRLLDEGIPYIIGSGYRPFTSLVDRSLLSIMEMLEYPRDMDRVNDALYKVLPALNKDELKRITEKQKCYFWDLDFTKFQNINNFKRCILDLKQASLDLDSGKPMSVYMPRVINLFEQYYWNFVGKAKADDDRQTIFYKKLQEKITFEDYSRDLTYHDYLQERLGYSDRLQTFIQRGEGVYITTFHGLKGLEFDTVYVMDLAEDVFPNKGYGYNSYDEETKTMIEQENNCLFYVVCTRAKERLVLMWSKNNPSVYYRTVRKALSSPTTLFNKQDFSITEEEEEIEIEDFEETSFFEEEEEEVEISEPVIEVEPIQEVEELKITEPAIRGNRLDKILGVMKRR